MLGRKSAVLTQLTGYCKTPSNLAVWQTSWFFLPRLKSIHWSALTSTFPAAGCSSYYPGSLPSHVEAIHLTLAWNETAGSKFSVAERLAGTGFWERMVSFTCKAEPSRSDTWLQCTGPMEKLRKVDLEASVITLCPMSNAIEHVSCLGHRQLDFYCSFFGLKPPSLNTMVLACPGSLRISLGHCKLNPKIVKVSAGTLHAPQLRRLWSENLYALSLKVSKVDLSDFDSSGLPPGAVMVSKFEKPGHTFEWTKM